MDTDGSKIAPKDFVENAERTAMGGDDGELAAPLGAGLGVTVKFALVFVEGKLVELDVTGPADDGIGVGGKGIDVETGNESEDAGFNVLFAVDDLDAEIFGNDVEDAGPTFAVIEVEASGTFIARGDPDVEMVIATGRFND